MSDERGPVPAGARVAGYRLDEQIGRGGMAVVYRAYDLQLGRQVALKVLDPVLAGDGEFRQRFIRESRAAAAVDHPNIIPVFAAGEADGVLFIAMRYVSGPDVRTLIDATGPLPARRAVDIVAQVAAALDTAHGRGLVHRDVKPANMLLDPAPGGSHSDHVYLSDFGLSKQALAGLGLTATGQLVGTLDYVAPEQIENRPVDGRGDQYSLACAAFEMLCGAPPFRRDQDLALLWAQLSEPPPPLTSRRPGLPPAVDQVIAQALAKSPGGRYPRCLDFAAALRAACLAGPGKVAGPPGPGQVAGPVPADEVDTALFPGVPSGGGRDGPPTDPADSSRVLQTPLTPPDEVSGPATDVSFPAGPRTDAPFPDGPRTEVPNPQDEPALTGPSFEPPTGPPFVPPSAAGPSMATGPSPASGRPPGSTAARGSRTWWRPRMVAGLVALVILGLGGTALAITHRAGPAGGQPTPGLVPPGLAPPGCVTASSTAPRLAGIRPRFVTLTGMPFAVTVTGNGRWSFVSTGMGRSIEVLRANVGPAPVLAHRITVPAAVHGEALTPDGRYLLAASGSGAVVMRVARAEHGRADSVLGTLSSPGGAGAVEVALSRDGRFAFVTLQGSGTLAVFNLAAALASGLRESGFVGDVRLGVNPIGITMAGHGQWLYVTTQQRDQHADQGTLSVVSVPRAESNPAGSVEETVLAGCDPGRVITTSGGSTVWVTARASNALLAFSAARLRSDPGHALIAKVRVGQSPIGLTALPGGRRILVANSGLHGSGLHGSGPHGSGPQASLGVISTTAALGRRPALVGVIGAGILPREFAVEPGGRTALITNSASHQLEAVNVSALG
ncbi:MAG TPA: protein kinase [Streptosporangiaceae bacterium]|nr:protein kinase [Streptosporangiaceae bacterium]